MIEGNKVVIRPCELGDEVDFHKWRNDSAGNCYCGLKHGFLLSREALRLELKAQIECKEVFPREKTFMICQKETGNPIGNISYRNWNPRNRSVEFGIEIGDRDRQSEGFGYDALSHFIEFLFGYLNVNRIELTTLADNQKAQNLYKKLGFQQSGLMREASYDS
jgi:RimJ/RimL family protein N-acetyltransferase